MPSKLSVYGFFYWVFHYLRTDSAGNSGVSGFRINLAGIAPVAL